MRRRAALGSPLTGRGRLATVAILAAFLAASLAAPSAVAEVQNTSGIATGGAPPPRMPERFTTVDNTDRQATAAEFDRLPVVGAAGSVKVVAGLRVRFTPEGALRPDQVAAQRAAIGTEINSVLRAVAVTRFEITRIYPDIPYLALRLSPQAVATLRASGRAASIAEDRINVPALSETTQIVESLEAQAFRRDGTGRYIAVLDTGVSRDHPFLQDLTNFGKPFSKLTTEACFSSNTPFNNASFSTSLCPGGAATKTGPLSAAPCTFDPDCVHGTHVAGIAVGNTPIILPSTYSEPRWGTARGAGLIGVQVFSRHNHLPPDTTTPMTTLNAWDSDILAGMSHVYSLRNAFPIAAVNMSLGTRFALFATDCGTSPYEASMANLRSFGIATVVSSGNDGFFNGVGSPSCAPSAITVGATTKGSAETVAGFTNMSPQVELLAPGVDVRSSVPGGGFANFSGTSMAAPHVAGAWAILRQVSPTASVAAILQSLQDTGKPIPSSIATRPRIRILSAFVRFADTGFRSVANFSAAAANVVSQGTGLVGGSGTIGVTVPPGAIVMDTFLYWMTLGGPDATAVVNGTTRGGGLIGASQDTCRNVNQLGANRVYRNTLANALPGVNTYTISGIGGTDGVVGQGASIVVVYRLASGAPGRVVISHGAMTANYFSDVMQHSFSGLTVPSTVTQAELHVGFGDGDVTQSPSEFELKLGTTALAPTDAISGSDGARWDDLTVSVPVGLLSTSVSNSIESFHDCIAWGYAALTYR